MRYTEYRDAVQAALRLQSKQQGAGGGGGGGGHDGGLTWAELKAAAALPYDRPCPTWTAQLEQVRAPEMVHCDGCICHPCTLRHRAATVTSKIAV